MTVPLWGLISAGISALTGVGVFTWWCFNTFYQRKDAFALEQALRREQAEIQESIAAMDNRNAEQQKAMGVKMEKIDDYVGQIRADVAYMRGSMERSQ